MIATQAPAARVTGPDRLHTDAAARGVLLLAVLHAVLAAAAYFVLAGVFGFPDILRQPGEAVLEAFTRNTGIIRVAYYAFTLSSVLLVPIAVLARRGTAWEAPGLIEVAAGFGLLAGFSQVLGFSRWPLYIPFLADSFAAASPGSPEADAIVLLYEAANRYSGMTVGEHLGWLFQGLWLVCLGSAVVRQRAATPWLGWLGVAIGVMMLLSAGEQFQAGFEGPLGMLNAVVTTAAPFWLIALAVWLVRGGWVRSGER